ncbi:unnamed protein product [Prorocentrum cordatum]|uniref:Fungal lipase-like domain-containing protein n=1 Tax=Prorocentrum cordatum TaxID=2364126 RepID=A0ABN9WDS7_9DINO|nr:unnamed protein product [Polarella glacialis]
MAEFLGAVVGPDAQLIPRAPAAPADFLSAAAGVELAPGGALPGSAGAEPGQQRRPGRRQQRPRASGASSAPSEPTPQAPPSARGPARAGSAGAAPAPRAAAERGEAGAPGELREGAAAGQETASRASGPPGSAGRSASSSGCRRYSPCCPSTCSAGRGRAQARRTLPEGSTTFLRQSTCGDRARSTSRQMQMHRSAPRLTSSTSREIQVGPEISREARSTSQPLSGASRGGASEVVKPFTTKDGRGDERTHADLVEAALVRSCLDYPRYAGKLGRLAVAHASQDMAVLVDHEDAQLFACVRGTSPFVPRDLSDDARVIMGLPPARVADAKAAYRAVRKQFPGYRSYGCGHSLGGSVMHELAYVFEKSPRYRFTRVDVFNAGGSPLQRRNAALKHTVFLSHRVTGDLVSYFYDPPGGGTIEHKERPQFGGAHWMGHFLPRRRVVAAQDA